MATKDRTSLKNDFANGKYATGEKFADLIDSMKVVQLPVVDPQALGTSLSFIDSITQDADGKITATKKTLDLENAHELNPFKGWYKTGDTLPTDGFDGAYLYFKDTSELTGLTTIYRWNGTAYADSGVVVDTSNVNTFETGQAVSGVAIDNSGLANPADNALAKAGDVMQLAAKLEGVTVTEMKQTVVDWCPSGSSSGYYDSSAVWHTNSNYKSARFDVAGAKRVRFLGFNKDYATYDYGYGFLDSDGVAMAGKFSQYRDTNRPWESKCEIEVAVPDGAKYFVCLYTAWSTSQSFQNFKESDFYCYIQSGDSVKDMLGATEKEVAGIVSRSIIAIQSLSVGWVSNGFIRGTTGLWVEAEALRHGYVDVSSYRGKTIKVTNNENAATSVAFVTAIDTVTTGATPSYVEGWTHVEYPADGEIGGSEVYVVPETANYMYVYLGENRVALPEVVLVENVAKVVSDIIKDKEGMGVPVRLFPLWTPWHIRGDNGVVDSGGNWEMFAHPVKAGEKLRLTATKNSSSELALVLYGFSVDYPSVGDTITATAIDGVQGETKVVELIAESDGWFVFSSSMESGSPKWSYTLEMLLPLSGVVAPKMSKGLEYGMRELHFTEPLSAEAITETYSGIHGLYDALVTNHGEAFERLSDILENDGSDNEIRLYRLGYKNFGGLFTGYDFENAAANGYYADANDGGRSHGKKRILLDAGVHGDEKAAVYGLYYFCKSVLESNDPWAVYIKSNYVIDVIPIVSTKNYKDNSRTGSDTIDPNRNFGERTLVQVAAVAAFVDEHAGEYNLHVDCHNQSNLNAKSKCFVGCVRGSKGFEDMVEFARRFSGIARGNWGLLPWYKPHVTGGTLVKVTDPMIVIQTNASSELVADNYKMTFPSCTRVYGAVSITMEAPRQLTNVTTGGAYQTPHYDAAKMTADMLIELTRLADGAGLADEADW